MTINITRPTKCEACGFHNFRITGTIYNGTLNTTNIKVKCMRCGKIQTHIE